jgi:CubicO group peptidase (beta-lactamase class C family)
MEFEELERFIEAELECRRHPGSSVAVVKGDEVVWAKGFGYADLEEKRAAAPETVYRCASVTKPVVTVALLQLMEKGKFELDDPVEEHIGLEIVGPYERRPTIRELLTHRSGMPTRVPPIFKKLDEALPLREYVESAARAVRPPGERWEYCNTAYAMVGLLIEAFSGEPYNKYVVEHVLKPLEMDSSGFEETPEIRGRLATGYVRWGGPDQPLKRIDSYFLGTRPEDPAGSLFSTVIDLSHFVIMQLNGGVYRGRRILGEETLEEMQKLQASAGSSRSGMALTWFRSIHDGHVMLAHTGGMPGYTNHVAFYPELRIGVCWLSNLNDGTRWRPPAPTALRIVAGEAAPLNPERVQRVPEEWRKLVGNYGERGRTIRITMRNGYLIVEGLGAYLEKVEEGRYIVHGSAYDGYELTFEYDEEGKVKQIDISIFEYLRYVEEPVKVDEEMPLKGHWRGEYHHPYGFYQLDIVIGSATRGMATDMDGRLRPFEEFSAERGRVRGVYRFKPPKEYQGWMAEEFRVEVDLHAAEGDLRGLLRFTSKRPGDLWLVPITLKRI